MSRPRFIQARKSFLKTPISSSETGSFVLNQLVDCYGKQISTSNFASVIRFTFNPGGSDEEIITATNFTVNADGSVTVNTGITRGLSATYPYTSGGTASNHAAGTPVIVMPDNPQTFEDICAYIDSLVIASAVPATKTSYGYVRTTESLSVIPRVMTALVSQKSSQPSMKLTVQPFAVSSLDKDVALVTATDTSAMVAPVTNPRVDLIVYDSVNTVVTVRTGTENASLTTSNYMTYKPTPTVGDIVLAAVFHRVGEVKVLEEDDSSNGFIIRWYTPEVYGTTGIVPTGIISPYGGRSAPSGWVLCDGTSYSRTSAAYSPLFSAICPGQTATITIASPGVVTATGHGLVAGDKIHFTTTGGLPSGISTNTDYYVLATSLTSDTFKLALSPAGTAVVTTGSQNGTHTVYKSPWGKGDGSTTFSVPDFRGKNVMGLGATNNITLSFEAGAVNTGADTIAVPDGSYPVSGQAVTLTSTGTLPAGLATSTTYYVIRLSSTSIQLASSQANVGGSTGSGTAVPVNITDTGTAGAVHTINYALTGRTILGQMFGEETHTLALPEIPSHYHSLPGSANTGNNSRVNSNADSTPYGSPVSGSAGNSGDHNNISPNVLTNYIIKL